MLAHLELRPDGRRVQAVGATDACRIIIGNASYPISEDGLDRLLVDPDARAQFARAATDFEEFLRLWRFRDQETGRVRILGDELWESQIRFAIFVQAHPWTFALKARKLGISTASVAYAAWVARFGPESCRVHLFSRRDLAAQDLVKQVKFGLDGLPDYMRLPIESLKHRLNIDAGGHDARVVEAYPTSDRSAVEATAAHTLLDELASMGDPAQVYQATEPSVAPNGSMTVVTTGRGPVNWASLEWKRAIKGESKLSPCFIEATARPGRTPAWLEGQRRSMGETQFKQEYPLEWSDALIGPGERMFLAQDLDACEEYAYPLRARQEGHRYVTAWDLGERDASVGVVLDCTEAVLDVAAFVYLKGAKYPEIQRAIEKLHGEYPGPTVIEKNGPGSAVIANLGIPSHELIPFSTTGANKPRIISQLALQVENHEIAWSPRDCPQLSQEMRVYAADDEGLEQDTIMSLAICIDSVKHASGGGAGYKVLTTF
jgi:hypothetical protein